MTVQCILEAVKIYGGASALMLIGGALAVYGGPGGVAVGALLAVIGVLLGAAFSENVTRACRPRVQRAG